MTVQPGLTASGRGNNLSVVCAIFRRDRPPGATTAVEGDPCDVFYDNLTGEWSIEAPCERCGGYRMGLQVSERHLEQLARARATAFLTRVHARGGCLGCAARRWREGARPASGQPHVWWDTETGQWMAWRELDGLRDGVSLPLGIRTFWAPQEVRAGARALWSCDRLPLRVACEPGAVDDGAATTFYDADSGRWKLHVACFDCGGFELRLASFGRGAVDAACEEALDCLRLVAREGCPHCRTLRERSARDDDDEPRIWFDTQWRDWLVWQALEGCVGGVTLPLGIRRFDAPRSVVYRAAAALLFDSELFLDEGL